MDPENNLVPRPRNRKKNFSKNKKHPNFPSRVPKPQEVKILPSHRAVFENYKEQGFKGMGKAVRRTRLYSPSVESRTHVITSTQSWKALMDEYMPEEMLSQRHAELLDKRDYRKMDSGEVDEKGKKIMIEVDNGPETQAVAKGLEMAYKLRGSFSKDEAPKKSTVMYNLFYKPEVREQMKTFEEGIKQSLLNEINKRNLADIKAEEERGKVDDPRAEAKPVKKSTKGLKKTSYPIVGD